MHISAEPTCYYVFEQDSSWLVEFDSQAIAREFPSRDKALLAAREAAESRWLMTGNPSCVRVGHPKRQSVVDETYG